METTAQTCGRLLTALEDLAACEAATLREGDFSAVAGLQARAAPLVEFIGTHGPALADEAFRSRIEAVLRQRTQSQEWLGTEIAQVREDLQATRASEHRAARIAPVYGSPTIPVAGQLSAVG